MTNRIENIINKEIELATGVSATGFEGRDFIRDLTANFIDDVIEKYVASYVRNAVYNYIDCEETGIKREDLVSDIKDNLVYDNQISW